MGNLGVAELILILIVAIVCAIIVTVWPFWKIFGRAGLSPALSLLMLVPVANIVIVFYLAYADWPVLKKSQDQQQ